jgi:uncharacterized OsmC-like protein
MERDAELGKTRFRATNKWIDGTHNRSAVYDFYGAGEEKTHQERFESDADEPFMLGGHDQAPNPAEHLLNALAACVTTSMVAHAAARGIHIEELESQLEGDIDLRGFLGVSNDVPKGYTSIRVKFRVKADVDNMERLRRLTEYSPVYNTLLHGTNVEVEVEPM